MRFYLATRFLFPRNYPLRVFAICFATVHLPLIAFCVVEALRGQWHWALFLPLLIATLLGTVAAIAALRALLAPIEHATALLAAVQRGEPISAVPIGGRDLVGDLLDGVGMAATATASRIERLTDAAGRDVLTGLRNRRGFLEECALYMRSGGPTTIALIDLDHFKSINDRFGHDEGDRALQDFADRLVEETRGGDVVARWGGEEFVVLLTGADQEAAKRIIGRLRLSLHAQPVLRIDGDPLTFSCGLAPVSDHSGLHDAMQAADTALYASKRAGRDTVTASPPR